MMIAHIFVVGIAVSKSVDDGTVFVPFDVDIFGALEKILFSLCV